MSFEFSQPPTLGAALDALAGEGALPIAGGTALVPRLRRRADAPPRLLVHVSRLAELRGIRADSGALAIGAATTLSEIARSPEVRTSAPLLADLCGGTRSPQIRNAATLGGSLLSGPDFAEPALALLALGARATLRSRQGEREVAVEDILANFAADVEANREADGGALRPGELIVGFSLPASLPATDGARFGLYRVARREAIEPPLVAAAVAIRLGARGVAEDVRICLGVATPRPLRLRQVEAVLRGSAASGEAAKRAAADALSEIPLRPDVRAGEEYRRRMIPVTVARSVEAALGRDR